MKALGLMKRLGGSLVTSVLGNTARVRELEGRLAGETARAERLAAELDATPTIRSMGEASGFRQALARVRGQPHTASVSAELLREADEIRALHTHVDTARAQYLRERDDFHRDREEKRSELWKVREEKKGVERALLAFLHPQTGHAFHEQGACTGECREARRVLAAAGHELPDFDPVPEVHLLLAHADGGPVLDRGIPVTDLVPPSLTGMDKVNAREAEKLEESWHKAALLFSARPCCESHKRHPLSALECVNPYREQVARAEKESRFQKESREASTKVHLEVEAEHEAELETLRADVARLEQDKDNALAEVKRLEDALRTEQWLRSTYQDEKNDVKAWKNRVYTERNELAAALARAVLAMGGTAGTREHPAEDTSWEPDWRGIVMVDLPTGQASWHVHDSERHLLEGLPVYPGEWDGHTTEEKRDRVRHAFAGGVAQAVT